MSSIFIDAARFDRVSGFLVPEPSITQWQRLEADPAELDLAASLEAQLADPLWLIGRQWQFAELKAEDAGMPILVHLVGDEGPLSLEGSHDPDELPEVRIEAEPARRVLASIALEAGIDLEDALIEAGAGPAFEKFQEAFPLNLAPLPEDLAGQDLAILLGRNALDANALAEALEQQRGPDGTISNLPQAIDVPSSLASKALAAASAWLDDWQSLLVDPEAPCLWKPERLEYAARLSAATAAGSVPIKAAEYGNGRFDWWAMDVMGKADGSSPVVRIVDTKRIPAAVRFPGMTADRLFEIEPDPVGVIGATTGPTGILTMLLIEYAVAASNDWYQVPLTLSYGSTFQLTGLSIWDSFGVETKVGPSASGADPWSMFTATARRFGDEADSLFLFPAATAHVLEGEAIEEVAFFRDEMANLAWAVEQKLPGLTPAPVRATTNMPLSRTLVDPDTPDAALIYRLQTPLPANWWPLAPEPQPGSANGATIFRLRHLRRLGEPDSGPKAELLQSTGQSLLIEEREVPRSGLLVSRSFQCARDSAGRRRLWLGRRKNAGRGEGSSGLRFDLLDHSGS
jgi:hypothetical protein